MHSLCKNKNIPMWGKHRCRITKEIAFHLTRIITLSMYASQGYEMSIISLSIYLLISPNNMNGNEKNNNNKKKIDEQL